METITEKTSVLNSDDTLPERMINRLEVYLTRDRQ